MLGAANCDHQSLHHLAANRFAVAALFGKLANTCADLDKGDVSRSGLLKQIVAGDTLSYEKKFKDSFSAPVTARLVYSANTMPVIQDGGQAVTDRLILVEFPERFEEHQQDRHLPGKLTATLEGVLAQWAIPGLLDLIEKNQFDIPKRSAELLRNYKLECDPFLLFAQENVEKVSGAQVKKSELHTAYAFWCQWKDLPQLSKVEFNKRISAHFNILNLDRRASETRERVWEGIRLKDQSQESQGTSNPKEQVEYMVEEEVAASRDSRDEEIGEATVDYGAGG